MDCSVVGKLQLLEWTPEMHVGSSGADAPEEKIVHRTSSAVVETVCNAQELFIECQTGLRVESSCATQTECVASESKASLTPWGGVVRRVDGAKPMKFVAMRYCYVVLARGEELGDGEELYPESEQEVRPMGR